MFFVYSNPFHSDDEIPYILSRPINQTVGTDLGQATAVVTWSEPTIDDNSGSYTVTSNFASGSSFPLGMSTVDYRISDASGNNNTFSFVVMVYGNY